MVLSNRSVTGEANFQGFNIGDVVMGIVQSVKPYGAFVDIGGATGLLHISQITHERLLSVDNVGGSVEGGVRRQRTQREGRGRAKEWHNERSLSGM